jgi:transcriptional regulator with XRE-family HTH domain
LFNGPKLKELRKNRGWSQWDVAVRTSYTDDAGKPRMIRPEQIAKYELGHGQPSATRVSILAAVFGVQLEVLLAAPTLLHAVPDEAAQG